MSICPVCNGLKTLQMNCRNCQNRLVDYGRMMDYYDDYSPYMSIDLMKLEDGYPDTYKEHKCPHLYHCPQCQHDEVILIKE